MEGIDGKKVLIVIGQASMQLTLKAPNKQDRWKKSSHGSFVILIGQLF